MGEYVRQTLQEGLFGWQVTDCVVTMTGVHLQRPDGPPSRRGPLSTAADFRKLTPLVLMQALERARTVVCEPTVRASLEIPTDTIGAVLRPWRGSAPPSSRRRRKGSCRPIEAVLPATRADELQRQLPGLTGGEGVLESSFAGYQPVSGRSITWVVTFPASSSSAKQREVLAPDLRDEELDRLASPTFDSKTLPARCGRGPSPR